MLIGTDKKQNPAAMVLTVYAIRASALAFDQLCHQILADMGGTFESGELIIAPVKRAIRSNISLYTLEALMGDRRTRTGPENPRSITSLQNDRIKAVRALEMRKVRRETELFVAEGISVLETARQAGWTPETLIYLKDSTLEGVSERLMRHALSADTECLEVTSAVLSKLATKDNPQSMLGVFRQRWSPLPEPQQIKKIASGSP